MEGLINFFKVDNHCALDVDHLNEGIRSFEVRGPKFKGVYSEASIRKGSEELTLRAEEVGSQKACINVGHIAEYRWRPPVVDADIRKNSHANVVSSGGTAIFLHEGGLRILRSILVLLSNARAGVVNAPRAKRNWLI